MISSRSLAAVPAWVGSLGLCAALCSAQLSVPVVIADPGTISQTPAGGPPVLVADLGQRVPITDQDAFAGLPLAVTLDDAAYFFFDDGIHGYELWRSDGTTAGTSPVADLCPGACGAARTESARGLAATGSDVFFAAHDGVHGVELWATDGTPGGTRLVRDLAAGLRGAAPGDLTAVGERVFFTADDARHGRELWLSDGTPAGTRLVADLVPGELPLQVHASAALGGALVFSRSDTGGMDGLWRSDGTAAGTVRLAEILSYDSWSASAPFVVLGDLLLFAGIDLAYTSLTLWRSDGTAAGTWELAPLDFPDGFVTLGDQLVFTAWQDGASGLYRTDGTLAGTVEVPLPEGSFVSGNGGFRAAAGGLLFLAVRDNAHGSELWVTDGVTTTLVKDIFPGPGYGLPSVAEVVRDEIWHAPAMTSLGGRVVFFADDGVHGREPWTSDGTAAGTLPLADLTPGTAYTWSDGLSSQFPQAVVGGAALFAVRVAGVGSLLVSTDGRPEGTSVIAGLDLQTSALLPSADGIAWRANAAVGRCLTPLAGGLALAVEADDNGRDVWFAAGDGSASHRLGEFSPYSEIHPRYEAPPGCQAQAGGGVLSGRSPGSYELDLFWTAGQPDDVERLTAGGPPEVHQGGAARLGAGLALGGWGGVWRTDGTAAGSYALGLLPVPSDPIWPNLETLGDHVFVGDQELWVTAGAPGDLALFSDLGDPEPSWPVRLTRFGTSLLFFATDAAHGTEPWTSDGTPNGTTLLRDLQPGAESSIREEARSEGRPGLTAIVPLGAGAVFAADDGIHGEELWVTDGTSDGTRLLADLHPGTYPSSPCELTRVGNWVYFVAELPGVGRELLRTNGAPGGTQLVVDLVGGPGSSLPQQLTAAGSELYFSAWTPGAGREPWRLRDGAPAASLLVPLADLAPGPLSSSPLAFLEVGGTVFFAANDNTLGFELWTVREPDAIFSDGFESSSTAVWSVVTP
jgi:ELWxxDGT repeat protein